MRHFQGTLWQRLSAPGRPKGPLPTLRPGALSPPSLGRHLSSTSSFSPLFPSLRLRTKVEVKCWGWLEGEAGPPRTCFLCPQGLCLLTVSPTPSRALPDSQGCLLIWPVANGELTQDRSPSDPLPHMFPAALSCEGHVVKNPACEGFLGTPESETVEGRG